MQRVSPPDPLPPEQPQPEQPKSQEPPEPPSFLARLAYQYRKPLLIGGAVLAGIFACLIVIDIIYFAAVHRSTMSEYAGQTWSENSKTVLVLKIFAKIVIAILRVV
jgi:hypothetical protein